MTNEEKQEQTRDTMLDRIRGDRAIKELKDWMRVNSRIDLDQPLEINSGCPVRLLAVVPGEEYPVIAEVQFDESYSGVTRYDIRGHRQPAALGLSSISADYNLKPNYTTPILRCHSVTLVYDHPNAGHSEVITVHIGDKRNLMPNETVEVSFKVPPMK